MFGDILLNQMYTEYYTNKLASGVSRPRGIELRYSYAAYIPNRAQGNEWRLKSVELRLVLISLIA